MNLNSLLSIAAVAFALFFMFGILAFVFSRFYIKSSKDQAIIRTGSGGEKIIKDGGVIVIPIFHQVARVSLSTVKLSVRRSSKEALISKDRIRVDAGAEFFVRVKANTESISMASETLGEKVNDGQALKEFFEGKLVDSLRAVASNMTLTELHEQRPLFVQKVQEAVGKDIEKNGFELESVSLTHLDQTKIEDLDESNIFDAEGLRLISSAVSEKRKERNDIEKNTEVAIETKNLEASRRSQELRKEREFTELDTNRLISERTNEQQRIIAGYEAETRRTTEEARISTDVSINVAKEQSLQQVEIATQQRNIAVHEQSQLESQAQAQANKARAEAIESEENLNTVREKAVAVRSKEIAVVKAEERAETEAVKIRVEAAAELEVAEKLAQAALVKAKADKDASELRAQGILAVSTAEAEGVRKLNEAENTLSAEQLSAKVKTRAIETLPAIIAASAEPIKSIDSIKIVDMLGGQKAVNSQGGANLSSSTNMVDRVYDAAMNYRVNAPLIDSVTSSLGLGDLASNKGVDQFIRATLNPVVQAPAKADVNSASSTEADEGEE